MNEDDPDLTVDEFVDYCRTQAGLLSGHIETIGAEADELLDEIDAEMAEIREQLDAGDGSIQATNVPESTDGPDEPAETGVDVAAIEEREADLESKQKLVEAKQARMRAYQDLAAGYTALAGELASDAEDGQAAMTRVVEFEAAEDAPAYFEEQTVLEAAVESTDGDGGE
ncbi:hypothetical protein SAMN05216559_0393 [Halomicrobium zhouii]|uniref:Uncharacterized protein n=1 Tax=Halomicrobium zhouii TaxID=767519 RepID=A0A1I6K982_9EURY|nr:hypothetical protein [Halomicrobium zhouii]SFR87704.1 hypothetical protein SAMN05216559_0393 [Halomicrobium zhouii]